MSAPTKECRPCPKCGQSILRSTENPARCGYCKDVKLRARIAWAARCQDCGELSDGGKPITFRSQPWTTKAEAKRWARNHAHDRFLLFAVCDCGWETDGHHVVWVSLEEQVRFHKHQEHTP